MKKSIIIFTVSSTAVNQILRHEFEVSETLTPAIAFYHAIYDHSSSFDVPASDVVVYVGQLA